MIKHVLRVFQVVFYVVIVTTIIYNFSRIYQHRENFKQHVKNLNQQLQVMEVKIKELEKKQNLRNTQQTSEEFWTIVKTNCKAEIKDLTLEVPYENISKNTKF
jgi:TolA-binding protein